MLTNFRLWVIYLRMIVTLVSLRTFENISKTNKDWLPNNTHHSVKTFIESINKDLTNAQRGDNQLIRNNLTKGEIHSLHHLKNRDDIIITKDDKGGAVVIVNVEDYLAEAKRQLDNTNFYTKLDVIPTATHADIVNNTIRNLPEHIAKALVVDNPKTVRFYLLHKVHKINNRGRPITDAINSPTSSIAEFVEFQLQPMVQNLKSYIKDFLTKLGKIKKDFFMVYCPGTMTSQAESRKFRSTAWTGLTFTTHMT